eukprot:CAMPEP_0175654594 /NCGR_PEP_ID=MMETSP0097-20121207/11471_1 /TAXON_ID=311494 /ORGANISM="Alexandrium monilatum, Strain CCMP3105" /LENGTH=59 /DNA_ID=CAMNT_0016960635 /DNA_START=120 /DNA_END=296 /DNA_ORIENTATION=-
MALPAAISRRAGQRQREDEDTTRMRTDEQPCLTGLEGRRQLCAQFSSLPLSYSFLTCSS